MNGELLSVPIHKDIVDLKSIGEVYRQMLLQNIEINKHNKTNGKKWRLIMVGEIFEEPE